MLLGSGMFPSGLQGTMLGFLVVLLAGDIPAVDESVSNRRIYSLRNNVAFSLDGKDKLYVFSVK